MNLIFTTSDVVELFQSSLFLGLLLGGLITLTSRLVLEVAERHYLHE